MEMMILVFRTVTAVGTQTEAVIDDIPNDGIFLGKLSRELVILCARLQKLRIGLLELSASGEELVMTQGQSEKLRG